MRHRSRPAPRVSQWARVCAAVVLLALGAGGCSTIDKAQSAAVVNGTPIYTDELAQVTSQFNDAFGAAQANGQKLTEAQTLSYLIESRFVVPYISSTNVYRPDAQYAQLIDKVPGASQDTKDFILTIYVFYGQLLPATATAAIDAEVSKAKIEVAPRYGTFDPTTRLLSTATSPDWIKASATPSASPTTAQ